MIKLNPTEKELNGLKRLIDIAVQGSEYFSGESPKWLRPLTKFFAFTFILLFMLLMTPFILLKRNFPNSYQNLKTELISRWHSESSVIALNKLREVHRQLLQHSQSVMLGGYKIEPYGKFNFYDYANVAELLYQWEIQHQNIAEALKICEEMLEPGKKSKNMSKIYADWIIKKARAIRLLSGDLAAQEYLLRYIDQNSNKCRVKEYLHELRKAS